VQRDPVNESLRHCLSSVYYCRFSATRRCSLFATVGFDLYVPDANCELMIYPRTKNMHNPPHPGLILRETVLPTLDLTVVEAAIQLGVSPSTLSDVINARVAISRDMAARLAQWISGLDARMWLRMQLDHDLWQLETRDVPKVSRAVPGPKATG
jgi:addiction module HigA family antidote